AKNLGAFFDSWLNRVGLPSLTLAKAGLKPVATADRRNVGSAEREKTVVGEIVQELNGHQLAKVDVTVETDKAEYTKSVSLKGERTPFEFELPTGSSAPRRIIVDKYYTAARANGGVYSVMSFYPEQEHTLIVYGTQDEVPTNREAAAALQKAICERWSNYDV